jgi:hypothetical protein
MLLSSRQIAEALIQETIGTVMSAWRLSRCTYRKYCCLVFSNLSPFNTPVIVFKADLPHFRCNPEGKT